MLRTLLICGLVAGLCGALVATGVGAVAGEPAIDRAIAYESAGHGDVGHAASGPVSRGVQKSVGLLTVAIVYGAALGGIFALVFMVAYGRVARAGPGQTALWLAAGTFAVLFLVPFLKYPASPPGASDPDTIGRRTALYVVMIAVSVLAAVAAGRLRPVLVARVGRHGATAAALGLYVVVVAAGGLALPPVADVPRDFPATTLWDFRVAAVGMQAVLWATIGVTFAWAAQRAMTGRPVVPRRAEPRHGLAAAED